jgi:hypothetical protein
LVGNVVDNWVWFAVVLSWGRVVGSRVDLFSAPEGIRMGWDCANVLEYAFLVLVGLAVGQPVWVRGSGWGSGEPQRFEPVRTTTIHEPEMFGVMHHEHQLAHNSS